MPSKTSRRNQKQNDKAGATLVGPDYIQVLNGELLNKRVNLILCGESHEDAIDVTRAGGFFKAKEGWISTSVESLSKDVHEFALATMDHDELMDDDIKIGYRVWGRKDKIASLDKAREWSASKIENDLDVEDQEDILLIWIKEKNSKKGKAFILILGIDDKNNLETTSGRSEESNENRKLLKDNKNLKDKEQDIKEIKIIDDMMKRINEHLSSNQKDDKSEENSYVFNTSELEISLFEWGDLDDEARLFNRRRLLLLHDRKNEVNITDHDAFVEKRKRKLRENEGTWTFDDWFSEIKKNLAMPQEWSAKSADGQNISLHLVLEGGIPPWEVEFHREKISAKMENEQSVPNIPHAPECIRMLPDDSEASLSDDFDPSSDGMGSYLDFVYRKFMEEMLNECLVKEDEKTIEDHITEKVPQTTWCHCVDNRDLGCERSIVSERMKTLWVDFFSADEHTAFSELTKCSNKSPATRLKMLANLPNWITNPEDFKLLSMFLKGTIAIDDDDDDMDEDETYEEKIDDMLSFPSFEGFFGQNTDLLYYAPHVKACYSPFLAMCVGSLSTWKDFFVDLFLGGTIREALSHLKFDDMNKSFIHIRSPLLKEWDDEKKEYCWRQRDDEDNSVTFPFLPLNGFLKASGSFPPRTWSSHLFAKLSEQKLDGAPNSGYSIASDKLAQTVKRWILESIQSYSDDPKNSDDAEGGGEWFLAYLRAVHREIYDDIDRSDPTILLKKKFMQSESSDIKHNIGSIGIPSCSMGFEEITNSLAHLDVRKSLRNLNDIRENSVDEKIEAMAKILIDIWMSSLVDFCSVLKIIDIIQNEKAHNISIVCYMGAVHTKSISNFFTEYASFKKKLFIGEFNWDEDASRKLFLPAQMWNIQDLIKS